MPSYRSRRREAAGQVEGEVEGLDEVDVALLQAELLATTNATTAARQNAAERSTHPHAAARQLRLGSPADSGHYWSERT